MRGWRIIFLLVLIILPLSAQIKDIVLSRVEIEVPTIKQMDKIAEQFEVLEKRGRFLEIIVPYKAIKKVEDISGFKARILEADIHAGISANAKDEYPSISQIEAKMKDWAKYNPSFVVLKKYGESTSKYPLLALKISDNPQKDEDEPEILLDAATHGDELITTIVLLRLIDKFVKGYGVDPQITKLVNEREIWIIPVVSPDGYSRRRRYVGSTDPNRDYPWPEKPNHKSIPCIHHLRTFFQERNIKGHISYHAYGQMIMYPWAYTRNSASDVKIFEKLTRAMAEFNGYRCGQISKIIYVAKGSSCDYYYWKHKTIALGIEIGHSKIPHGSAIDKAVNNNIKPAIYFIDAVGDVKSK